MVDKPIGGARAGAVMTTYKRILVPSDFSDTSARALEHAKSVAERFEASLELLHVVPNPFMANAATLYVGMPLPPDFLNELERDARQRLDEALVDRQHFKVRSVVKVGDPLLEIVEHARSERVDLIVMGTHGRTGVSHLFLGSVAERVVRTAACPVLTVR
jgi:nucleotide-binding universal stress UspA family protein